MKITYGIAALGALTLLTFANGASAVGLLVDPTGGTALSFGQSSDGSALRSLGGAYKLYDKTVTSLYVNNNGFLSVANGANWYLDRNVTTLASVVGSSVIAPLYDSLYLSPGAGNSVRETVGSTYYAVTFDLNGFDKPNKAGADSLFQATLFNAPTTINGQSFVADDIAFSYGELNHTITGSTFSVGVARNANNGTGAFGGAEQFSSTSAFMSKFAAGSSSLVFHYDADSNSYNPAALPAATPEPGSVALLIGMTTVGAGVLRKRRRINHSGRELSPYDM